jgi:phosphate-selective porin OprO/OprP
LVLAAVFLVAPDAGAQVPRPFPTAVPTPTPSPTPAPAETDPKLAATPVPEEAEVQPSATPVATPATTPAPEPPDEEPMPAPAPDAPSATVEGEPAATPEDGRSAADEDTEDVPKSEQETNPGDVAFTDYEPFDLDEIEPEPITTKWGNFVAGLRGMARYSLFDGQVKFRLGGRLQIDGTAGAGNDKYEEFYQPIDARGDVRRLTLFAAGRIKKFNFNLAFELGPDWGFSDAWIEGSEGGLEVWGKYIGKLRVGFMNEPFSLERATSSFHTPFMERSLPVQTIAPGTNVGVMVHDAGPEGRFSWAVGLFSFGQSNESNASNSALSLTGRLTYNLVYRNEGRNLVHLGVSASSRSPVGDDTRYRSRPEARFVGFLADTGPIDANHLTLLGLEFAAVQGPLWVSAEHIQSKVSAQLVGDPTFKGSYVQVGWFLTGESRPYRINSATWDRGRPASKFGGEKPFRKGNYGSLEVVGRLSTIDLNDGLVEGGQLSDFSAALNWYLNPTTSVRLNYIYASPKNQGSANIFILRFQYRPW